MSRSNYDKPFYVDVGTSIVAVRCASNHDVVLQYDHLRRPSSIELAKTACDRMNKEVEAAVKRETRGNMAAMRAALEKCRALAETIWQSEGGEDVSAEIAELKDRITAALSAPPRNCDRFRDWESAAAEYERLVQEGKAEDGTWCEWLFSVGQYASAQEGAANA